jgi:organic hydroperoxide reductase OsmC/OhrA
VKEHRYEPQIEWTGNRGEGTKTYRGYGRDHVVWVAGKAQIPCSSDPAFRGDASRYNPEELLVASLSACHMLWYLHLCSSNGVIVIAYRDAPSGWMQEEADGAGQFTRVLLRPVVHLAHSSDAGKAHHLHEEAHRRCFIARSVNFPVEIEPTIGAEA